MSLVTKTAQEVYDDLKSLAQNPDTGIVRMKNYNQGSVWRSLLWLFARVLSTLYSAVWTGVNLVFLDTYETGDLAALTEAPYLERRVGEMGVVRRPSQKTQGSVVFMRTNTAGVKTIPAGTRVATAPDYLNRTYEFTTDAEITLADGAATGTAAITAENVGSRYNVGTGAINVILSNVSGIDSVENVGEWITIAGADTETNADLARRGRLQWESLGDGPGLYESLAYEIPGVADVFVDDTNPRGPGTVDVIIQAQGGYTPDTLAGLVQTKCDTYGVATDDVLVKKATAVEFDVAVTATKAAFTGTENDVQIAMETLVDPAAPLMTFRLGEDVRHARFIVAGMAVPNVIDMSVELRVGGDLVDYVTCAPDKLAQLGTATVTVQTAPGN